MECNSYDGNTVENGKIGSAYQSGDGETCSNFKHVRQTEFYLREFRDMVTMGLCCGLKDPRELDKGSMTVQLDVDTMNCLRERTLRDSWQLNSSSVHTVGMLRILMRSGIGCESTND